MIDIYDSGKHTGQFDRVWPKLESAFEELADSVGQDFPTTLVEARAYKLVGERFQVYVLFSTTAAEDPHRKAEVGVVATCGTAFTLAKNLQLSAQWDRITCSASVVESTSRARGGHILREGPHTEFDLGTIMGKHAEIDRWVDATVTFVHENQALVIRELGIVDPWQRP